MTAAIESFELGSPGALAVARYSVTLVDTLTDSVAANDLPVSRVKYRLALNDTGTADLVVDVPAAALGGLQPEAVTEPVLRSCYIYRDDEPVFGGLITASEYDSSSETVALGLSDWWWPLDRRVIMPDPATLPPANVAERVVAFTDAEQADIVRELIRLAQLGASRDLKLVCTTGASGILRDRTYYGYELRNFGDSIRQIAGVIDGCDVRMGVTAREGFATPQRTVFIGTPLLGASGGVVVWEHGGNAFSYRYPKDGSDHADRFYAAGDGAETGTPIVVRDRATDLGQDTVGWPALDVVATYSGDILAGTLSDHADDELGKRRGSRIVLSTSVNGAMDPVIGAFELGQYARFVAANRYHELDVTTRIIGLEVEVDEDQGEVITPLISPVKG